MRKLRLMWLTTTPAPLAVWGCDQAIQCEFEKRYQALKDNGAPYAKN